MHVPPQSPQLSRMSIPATRVTIDVLQDLVCPWCYLGLNRLLKALARRPEWRFDLVWRPFLLYPDMPRDGLPHAQFIARKFGGDERAKRLYGTISEIGRTDGLSFAFDRIVSVPSSIDAHRLLGWSARQGKGIVVAQALFAAHFTQGRNIGDLPTLAAIADECGLSAVAALAFLQGEDESDRINADNIQAHRLGINGVPCYVIDGMHAIAGAQDPDVLERMLDVATASRGVPAGP